MLIGGNEIDRIWKEADCLVSEDQVERAIDQVATAIEKDWANKKPVILCVMTGGLVFAVKLLMKLRFPLEVDYVHLTRYGEEVVGGDVKWKVTPSISLQGRHILIVDDILDEGQTLLEIVDACKNLNASEVRSAVLVDKKHDRKVKPGVKADYTALEIEDRYLFGYGMDYKGYLRNASGIYAVKGL